MGELDERDCANAGKPTSNKPQATQLQSMSCDRWGSEDVGFVAVPSRCRPSSIMSAGLDQLDFQELQKARVGVSVGREIVQQEG